MATVVASVFERTLQSVHDDMGHQGIERTVGLSKQRCFWSGMHEDVEEWVKKCQRCILIKMPQPKVRAPLRAFLASRPPEVIAVDFTVLELLMGKSFKVYAGISHQRSKGRYHSKGPVEGVVYEVRRPGEAAL